MLNTGAIVASQVDEGWDIGRWLTLPEMEVGSETGLNYSLYGYVLQTPPKRQPADCNI